MRVDFTWSSQTDLFQQAAYHTTTAQLYESNNTSTPQKQSDVSVKLSKPRRQARKSLTITIAPMVSRSPDQGRYRTHARTHEFWMTGFAGAGWMDGWMDARLGLMP